MAPLITKFYRSALRILSDVSIEEMYPNLINEAIFLFGGNFGSIFLENEDKLIREYSTIPSEYRLEPSKKGHSIVSYKSGDPYIVTEQEIHESHPEANPNLKAILIIPIHYYTESHGVMSIQYCEDTPSFSPEDKEIIKWFGSVAGIAISKYLLYLKDSDLFTHFNNLVDIKDEKQIQTFNDFKASLRNKLQQGEVPNLVWAEALLWDTYQQVQSVKAKLQTIS